MKRKGKSEKLQKLVFSINRVQLNSILLRSILNITNNYRIINYNKQIILCIYLFMQRMLRKKNQKFVRKKKCKVVG